MNRRRGERTVLVALLGLALLLGCFPMSDFDVWWHLRAARLIVESHAVPQVDVLTYTNAGRPWIDLYWFFQLVLGGLYKLGGASALVFMKAIGGALVVYLAWLSRRRGGRQWPLLLVWLPALIVVSGRLCERPELFSLIYLAGYFAVLANASEKPRLLWLLPLVQVLWVNSHGFFVLGPIMLLVLVTTISTALALRRSHPGVWSRLHVLNYMVFTVGVIHAMGIGTQGSALAGRIVLGVYLVIGLSALAYRARSAAWRRRFVPAAVRARSGGACPGPAPYLPGGAIVLCSEYRPVAATPEGGTSLVSCRRPCPS